TPRLSAFPVVSTQFEFYFTGTTALTTVREVQRQGRYLGTGLSWTTQDLRVGTVYYWYVRSVSVLGTSDWVEVAAMCERSTDRLLQDFTGRITKTQLAQELLSEVNQKAERTELTQLNARMKRAHDALRSNMQTTAQNVTRLESQVGASSAKIEQVSKVARDIKGNMSASWTMKVQRNREGNTVITGIGLGFNTQGNSQFLVNAQNFAVISSLNGRVTTPFMVKNGQVFLDNGVIQTASIDVTKIKDASITSAKIGAVIQSDGYEEGGTGWAIHKNGNAEFYNGKFNGHITATSGRLENVTISDNCTINGQLSAARIVGDIAKNYVLKGNSVLIPAQPVEMQLLVLVSLEVDRKNRYEGQLYFGHSPVSPKSQAVLSSYATSYTTGGHNNESTHYKIT
ncbi:DUF1983 domain-containing protein, partial [Providencia alcalifaciens]|uniref:phage tail tip fiber protein n=1 Tax=Providencia alcalifaciens TaxID=126385 RepID=UPI0015D085A1